MAGTAWSVVTRSSNSGNIRASGFTRAEKAGAQTLPWASSRRITLELAFIRSERSLAMFMSARQLAKKSSVTENNKVRCLAAAAGGIAADRIIRGFGFGDREGRHDNLFSPGLETNLRSPSRCLSLRCFWAVPTLLYPPGTATGTGNISLQDRRWPQSRTLGAGFPKERQARDLRIQ